MSQKDKAGAKVIRFPLISGYNLDRETGLQMEAFEWAREEQNMYCPSPTKANYRNLGEGYDSYDHHLSFFADPNHPEAALARHYWPSQKKLLYHLVANYLQLERDHPEIVHRLIRNGIYAYLTKVT